MDAALLLVAVFLLLNLLVGLIRVWRGPTPADRLLAAQLFGTTTVALLLILAEAMHLPGLRDVSLLFVLLATLLSVAFVHLPRGAEERE